jgi:hypothetical protein
LERLYTLFRLSEKFLQCLIWRQKWKWSFWLKRIFEKERITWSQMRLDFFPRVKKTSRSSCFFWSTSCIILVAFISHRNYGKSL